MWTRTRITDLLGIAYPILQGPFGGGNSSAKLAAAVSNAGGLGAYGAVNLSPTELTALVAEIKSLTPKPFNINLWIPIAGEDDQKVSDAQFTHSVQRVRPWLEELGVPVPTTIPHGESFEAQAEALLAAQPSVFSFVMGIPDRAILVEAKRRGIVCIGTATTVDEAVAIADAGADAVVASGFDAGGHRGSFLRPVEESLVGTLSLVPQLVSAVNIPVIAAGGIADGRGIVAALALGAEAVQVGSAFLASPESGAPQIHKSILGTPAARWTRLTRAITGRLARGIESRLMNVLEEHPEDILPYPVQHWMTLPLRRAASVAERLDLLALWAGQNAASARHLPAAQVLALLVEETDAVLRATRLQPRG